MSSGPVPSGGRVSFPFLAWLESRPARLGYFRGPGEMQGKLRGARRGLTHLWLKQEQPRRTRHRSGAWRTASRTSLCLGPDVPMQQLAPYEPAWPRRTWSSGGQRRGPGERVQEVGWGDGWALGMRMCLWGRPGLRGAGRDGARGLGDLSAPYLILQFNLATI